LISHWDSVTGLKPGVNENVELRQLSDFWGRPHGGPFSRWAFPYNRASAPCSFARRV